MITSYRQRFCSIAGIAFSAVLGMSNAPAQGYPNKPIRMVVGPTAGSQADFAARTTALRLPQVLGQQVVVENRAGAGGAIAADFVAKSPADGYTMLLVSAADTVLPAMRNDLPYNLTRDFAPVSLLVIGPQLLVVNAGLPVKTIRELITYAQSQPGKLTYGSTGVGTLSHLAGELFKYKAKIDIVHVPFKGGADSAVAAAGGQISMTFPSIPAALPFMDAGKLRALVISGPKRMAVLPSVPTWEESGLAGYDRIGWYGILVPAGTPKDVIGKLNDAIAKVLGTPDMKEALNKEGTEPLAQTPDQFATFIKSELAQNGEIVKMIGVIAQ
jgi:tripartite-type tricarboxylate transporter receptor subunit TctC